MTRSLQRNGSLGDERTRTIGFVGRQAHGANFTHFRQGQGATLRGFRQRRGATVLGAVQGKLASLVSDGDPGQLLRAAAVDKYDGKEDLPVWTGWPHTLAIGWPNCLASDSVISLPARFARDASAFATRKGGVDGPSADSQDGGER